MRSCRELATGDLYPGRQGEGIGALEGTLCHQRTDATSTELKVEWLLKQHDTSNPRFLRTEGAGKV